MKILLLANSEFFIIKFKTELIERLAINNDVFVVPLPQDSSFLSRVKGSRAYRISRRSLNPFKEFLLIKDIFMLLIKYKPDVVITFTIKPNIYTGILTRFHSVHHIQVVTGLGSAIHTKPKVIVFLIRLMYKLALHNKSFHIFENKSDSIYFKKFKLMRNERVVNGAGVNLIAYPFKPYPVTELVKFVYVGRLMKEKGVLELLRATEELLNEGYQFSLTIVGEADENIDLSKWKNITNIIFVGRISEVMPYYVESHAIIHPSYHEGMSNVLLEAAATGRPGIASNIPGCMEIIDHNVSGYLFEKGSLKELKDAMALFISLPLIEKEKMGKNARNKVEKEFDRDLVNQEYIEIIHSIR